MKTNGQMETYSRYFSGELRAARGAETTIRKGKRKE